MGKDLKGKELGEGICQRKNGTYQARYTDRWGQRKSIYNKNLKEIRIQLAEVIADNENLKSVKRDVTLDEWFEIWIDTYKKRSVRPNTLREYTHLYTKHISPQIGGRYINGLIKSDIQRVVDKAYDEDYSYERLNKIKVVLKDMLQRASEDNLIVNNPVSGIQLRKTKEFNAKALSLEEQEVFFDFCRNTFYENLFNVAVNTGLRPGELFALYKEDVDLEAGYIDVNKTLVYQKYLTDSKKEFHLEPPKTKQSYRKVPINSICREYLIKQMALKDIVANKSPKCQSPYLFVTMFNTPINSVIYSAAISAVIKQINLLRPHGDQFENFSGHAFRHTFATRCFENGIEPKVVQAYLGHATLKMTMDLYTHVTEDKSAADIEKIVPKNDKVVPISEKMA